MSPEMSSSNYTSSLSLRYGLLFYRYGQYFKPQKISYKKTLLIQLFEFGSTKNRRQINAANPDVRNKNTPLSAFLAYQKRLIAKGISIFSLPRLYIFFTLFDWLNLKATGSRPRKITFLADMYAKNGHIRKNIKKVFLNKKKSENSKQFLPSQH